MRRIVAPVIIIVTLLAYLAGQKTNPPGFYIDESSIAFNAFCIAKHGNDEWGVKWPLYFAAFGEYKNPTYIYLLAAVFKIFHPSNLVARRLSAILGYAAAALIGVIAFAISRKRWIAWTIFLLALATPMLFEISRLVFEVALFPLVVAMFLFFAHRAYRSERWSAGVIAGLTLSLALITYTYSTGRLLGALFAVALFILNDRRGAAIVLAAYIVVGIVPLMVFNHIHNGALTARMKAISFLYLDAGKPLQQIDTLEQQYIGNLMPLGMALKGDPNPRHHVPNSLGSIDLGIFVLAIASICLIVRTRSHERWWIFVLVLTALSVLPASLTEGRYHELRLAPYPVMLLILAIPALESGSRIVRVAVVAGLALCLVQAIFFFHVFAKDGADRPWDFDASYPEVMRVALAQPQRPIYLATSYVHAYWYAALHDIPYSTFQNAWPEPYIPPGGLVVGSVYWFHCDDCAVVYKKQEFAVWLKNK